MPAPGCGEPGTAREAAVPRICDFLCNHASTRYAAHSLHYINKHFLASAIDLACPLVTYDERILRFDERHGRQYGFTALRT